MRKLAGLMLVFVVASLLLAAAPAAPAQAITPAKPVYAFYYAWYDMNSWTGRLTADLPVTPYNSYERSTIERHVGEARRAGLDGLILAWLGPENPTDANLQTLLSVVEGSDFEVSLYFETNSPFLTSREAVLAALQRSVSFASHPNWIRYQGKPVIFFWRPSAVPRAPGEAALSTWQALRQQVDPNREMIWIGEGDDFSYLHVFDGIHPYSIAWSADPAATLASYAQRTRAAAAQLGESKLWVPVFMPGYNDLNTGRGDAFVRERQDGQFLRSTFAGAVASQPDWAIVLNSFNEWAEGSMIEPSVTYGDKYLNLSAELTAAYRGSAPPWPPAPAPAADAPPTADQLPLADGYFFRQTGGGDGSGFSVRNSGGVPFWDEFQRLGGVERVGYPMSRRFEWNGFTTQVFQKAVFQWRPDARQVCFVNVFDEMSGAGKDEWLLNARSTPGVMNGEFDAGKGWDEIVRDRTGLLNANPAMKAVYDSAPNPMLLYGLPTSAVIDNGNHYAVRLQRAVIQQWKEDVPWARAGQATIANGGEVAVEAGMFDPAILAPELP